MDRPKISSSAERAVSRLAHQLEAIPESGMRTARVREWAHRQSPDDFYDALCVVLHRPPEGGTTFDPLLEALHEVLRGAPEGCPDPLPGDLLFHVYARAADEGEHEIVRLLCPHDAARALESPNGGLPREIADIPLGRRRSLAKGIDRRLLEQLGRDADPGVIQNLLHNPRMREADVLALATRRPAAAASLEAIGGDARWSVRPAVRAALARNPYTPVALALRMLNGLDARELREIRADGTLHADVRAHAADTLERRGVGSPKQDPR